MRTSLTLLFSLLLAATSIFAQTARVQVIHNSPDPLVDVYAGPTLLLNDFAFRTATPFIDLPAGVMIEVGIAPASSTSSADAIATFPVMFESGKTYVVMAAGVVGNTGATAFSLFVNGEAREAANNAGNVDVAVFHGSPDAPAVDVDAVFVADNVVADLEFGEYTSYLELPAAKYDLAVQPAGTNITAASFRADLSGLAGGAATVFASGFLASQPGFGLFAALPNGTVVELPLTPTARVQIIHNSPNPTVDVYTDNTRLLDNFQFRTATPFIDVPADRTITVGVAGENSGAATDAIATFPVSFETGKKYVVMAAGVVGNTGATAFSLFVNGEAREAANNAGNVDVAVFHGSPDAPAVDVDAVFVVDNVVADLAFGEYTSYLELPAAKYDLAVQPAGTNITAASFRADLSGLAGGAATVFASGFLASQPGFGLFAALPNGTVVELPLTPTARVQIIHNSPNPTVDVYTDNARLLDNFQFRTATPFIDVPADRTITVGVAGENSGAATDAIATFPVSFDAGETYVVVAAGVVGNTGATAFSLFVNGDAREASGTAGNVDVQLFHGSPDAPEVDVTLSNGAVLFDNVSFGEFADDYISVPSANYTIYLTPANDNSTVVAAYIAPLSLIPGQAVTVFASGFFTSGAPSFEVWAALSSGVTIPLQTTTVSVNELENNLGNFVVAPNPAVSDLQVRFDLKESTSLRYRILNFNGQLMQEGDFGQVSAGSFVERIQLNNLPTGMYNLEIQTNTGSKVTRFVVQQ